jgi:DNA-binding MarR family transcriptional regulator
VPVKFEFNNPMLMTWLLIHQAYNMVLKVQEKEFARIGLTPQYNGVFMVLRYKKGKVTIKDIAAWLDKNSNSISTLIDRMQRDGYVKRVGNIRDRREVLVELTEKGKEISNKSDVLGWKIVEDVLSGMPEEDFLRLNILLEQVRSRAFAQLDKDEAIQPVKTTKNAGKVVRAKKKRQSEKA